MSIITAKEIGQKVRQFRLNAKLTQEQLAVLVDVTFQQIQKYESGENRLNSDKLQQMAEVLKVPVAAFFSDEDDISLLLSKPEKEMLQIYRGIKDKKTRDALVTILSDCKKK